MIDNYCERLGPGLFAEPFNAISNISFLLAAWFSWLLVKKASSAGIGDYILILFIFSIGVGSTLFHTFANSWSVWLDVIPIFLFQICMLWLYTRNVVKLSFTMTLTLIVMFIGASIVALQFPSMFNGSLMYAPAAFVILLLGIFHACSQTAGRWLLMLAFVVFCISLFFRTVDDAICMEFPLGTHFIWHILHGLVLYLATRATITAHDKNCLARQIQSTP